MKTKLTLQRLQKGILSLLLPVALLSATAHAQTTLINPATDGGFELGTGSLADNGWSQVAATSNDTWYTATGLTSGAYTFPSTTRCAYISKDAGGGTWTYVTTVSPNAAHIYKTVTVPAGETQVSLSFKYQMNGSNNTKLMVYVCPSTAVPVSTEPQGNGGSISNGGWGVGTPVLLFSAATPQAAGTQTFTAPIPASFLNNCTGPTTFKVVFTSFRNSSGTTNLPPPAIDSISVISKTPVLATPAVFTINNTAPTSGTNFNTFTDAINWVNAVATCGLPNAITFNVSAGQTFNENTPYLTASGTASKPIIFQKSGAGANPVIRPNGTYGGYQPTTSNPGTQDYGICLHGADYITFDGIDINSNDLLPNSTTVAMATEYGYLIRNASPTNGANFNTIKNTTITLDKTSYQFGGTTNNTRGIVQTSTTAVGGGVSATNQTGTNNNNSYLNLTIGNVSSGIVLYGSSSTVPDANNIIGTTSPSIFNIIGRPGVADDIGNSAVATAGINLQNQFDATVSNCKISNVTGTGSSTVDGIAIGPLSANVFNGSGGFNNKIYNNQISNIRSSSISSTTAITGIRVQHDNTGSLGLIGFKIYNNAISNITSSYTGLPNATRVIRGLFLQAGAPSNPVTVQYEIINNTIMIDGSTSPSLSNIVFESSYNAAIYKFRNNLFFNNTGAQSGATHSVLGITNATTAIGAAGSLSDYNDFFYTNPTGGLFSYTSSMTTLAAWRALYNVDLNSISANPKLNSSTVLYPLYSSPLVGACPTLSSPYNKDIVNYTRSPLTSTIGAFEQAGDIIAPLIADTSIMGLNSTANRTLPDFLNAVDGGSIVATTPGTLPRIYYKKSTNANAFGANNSTFNGWKWVEASNATSPFSFTLDYSLLTSAVAIGDNIQYFYVAQDTVATPNIAALPAAGFVGTSVSSITQAPTSPKIFRIYNTPAAYVTSTLTQSSTAKVITSSTNQHVVRLAVQTGTTGDSAYVTSMVFNSAGVNDLANIGAARVWYTGTSSTFAATTQFGNSITYALGTGALGNMTFAGGQIIPPNATVYFWLSYDINASAISFDSVDASVVSVTYNGTTQIPVATTAAGARIIKTAYCAPALTTASYCISNVTFNTLNNSHSTCATPSYTNIAPTGAATTTVLRGKKYNLSVTQSGATTSSLVFIDYNDDGVFDASEATHISQIAGSAGLVSTVPITIPCNAVVSSEIRMRIRGYFTGTAPVACSTNPGEIEDYTISIADNPAAYVSSAAVQTSGTVSVGATDKQMMRLGIISQGCGTSELNSLYCQTAKTNNISANIANVKLYATGTSNVFSTNTLLANIGTSPASKFLLSGFTQPLSVISGDTNYFWITYDIKATATKTDTVDIAIDSINVSGNHYIPANNNPIEVLKVASQNAYLSSAVIHPATIRVPRVGQPNTPVLQIRIITTDTASALQLTQLNLATNAVGVDSTNIASAKVYYTGKTNAFSTGTQFGSNYKEPNTLATTWNPFVINGNQYLNFDTNYFWVAYDIRNIATAGNLIDADLTTFIINGGSLTPTTNTAAGSLTIQAAYCASAPAGTVGLGLSTANLATAVEEISNVTFGTLNNSSTCTQTGGMGSILNVYSDYTETVAIPSVGINASIPFSITGVSNCAATTASASTIFTIYIDWNQDGDFLDAGENVYRPANAAGVLAGRTATGNIIVPCTATLGRTRMRVIYAGGSNATNANPSSCGSTTYQFGETEDYSINVVNNPVAYSAMLTTQSSGLAGIGSTDANMMRIAIKATGCGTTNLTAMHFRTAGTTLNTDLTSAKLYATGTSNVFSTATLLGSASITGGAFNFNSLSQAITNVNFNDTNYFWLTYDVSGTAISGDTIDAVLDSIKVAGVNINTTASGNPAGVLKLNTKMAFVSAKAIHTDLSTVGSGTNNRQILRVMIAGTTNNAPVNITNLTFTVAGTANSLINLDSATLYYTGKSTAFATTTKFGTSFSPAPTAWGTYSFTGALSTALDTNYFWLTYNIKSTATIGDSVDAEFISATFDGATQVPSGTDGNPDGSVTIRGQYCASSGTFTAPFGYFLTTTAFALGGINNTSASCSGTSYTDYTSSLAARNISKGAITPFSITTQDCQIFSASAYVKIYIDYNQNGDFNGVDELAYSGVGSGLTGSIVVPCGAKSGLTRLRVVASQAAIGTACGNATSLGETEDYTVNILNAPISFTTSSAVQSNGIVSQGRTDQAIMNIKVKANGCGIARTTDMFFNTGITTNSLSNVNQAKLYTTGSSVVFNTSKLLGTVSSVNGSFNFTGSAISDTLTSDTINYWLAYDVSASANNGDTLDVRVDSIVVMDTARIPSNNNPSQFKTILSPMTISSVSATGFTSDRVGQGLSNLQAICIKVAASTTGAPVKATSFNFNTTGSGLDVNNLTQAKLYYTGNSSTFATTNQFGPTYVAGAAVAAGRWLPFGFTSEQNLTNDTNYFWLTFDVKATATIGDSIDVGITAITIDNVVQPLTNPAPTGNTIIRQEYCFSANSSGGKCIDTASVGSIFNATGISGCTSYIQYPKSLTTTNVYAGSSVPVYLTFTSATKVSIFIDLNKNGVFETTEEYNLTPTNNVSSISTSILIPRSALLGETRMRIRSFGGQTQGGTDRACSDWNNSESEDYTITILPPLPQITYVWNKTTPADFTVAGNWTPARTASTSSDRLVFGPSSIPLVVTNVISSTVKAIEISQATRVTFNAVSTATLIARDSLILADTSLVAANSNLTLQTGESIGVPGTLVTGNVSGIDAKLKRFVGSTNSNNLVFPFFSVKGSRALTLNYAVAPSAYGAITAGFVNSKALGNFGFPVYEAAAAVNVNTTCKEGYWNVVPSDGLSGGLYQSTFQMDSAQFVTNFTTLVVINRADEFSTWGLNGTSSAVFGSNTNATFVRNSMFGYGQFALAGDSNQNPLPVTLLSFNGKSSDNDALLSWSTASEKNNKGFDIERSADGRSFEAIGFVKGNGNSAVVNNYSFNDKNVFAAIPSVYYRLKQTDLNGQVSYSSVINVATHMQKLSSIAVYPNPFTSNISVSLNLLNDATVSILITDIQGKVIASESIDSAKDSNHYVLKNGADLQAGVYFLKITAEGESRVIKLIKR